MKKTVLAVFSHPDDVELMCAGTLAIFKKSDWDVHIATMTPGDKGSAVHTREEISQIRKSEAAASAKLLGATYHCLEFEDVYVMYSKESINRTTALIRRVQPSVVFTASPSDYMVDHEMTSKIVQTACFCCGIKNMEVQEEPFEPTPYLYYSDAMDGKDILGNLLNPAMYVDITNHIDMKAEMLGRHASQRNWLLEHHKIDEYILAMKRFAKHRGSEIGVDYAEGFRQHLGHGYQHDNILKDILGEYLIIK